MSDLTQQEHEEHRPVRRLLKELPKVEASPDFEQRLQRRIREGGSLPASASGGAERARGFTIPVFAYSLLTVLLVGLISYYSFFRTAETPVVPKAVRPAPAERRSVAPAPTALPTEGEGESIQPRDAAPPVGGNRARHGPSAAAPPKETARSAPKRQPVEELREEPLRQEAAPVVPPAPEPTVKAADEAEPQAEPRAEPQAEPQDLLRQKMEELIRPESAQKSIPLQSGKALKEVALPQGLIFSAPEAADSAAVRDSSAADSVRQVKSAAPRIRKPKPRRPGE